MDKLYQDNLFWKEDRAYENFKGPHISLPCKIVNPKPKVSREKVISYPITLQYCTPISLLGHTPLETTTNKEAQCFVERNPAQCRIHNL